jgi:hypothetical protein
MRFWNTACPGPVKNTGDESRLRFVSGISGFGGNRKLPDSPAETA